VEDRTPKDGEAMNYYMEFNPDVIQERCQQVLREVTSLRLQKRLRDDREWSDSRFFTLAHCLKSTLHLGSSPDCS
jgi:hypothetical protein